MFCDMHFWNSVDPCRLQYARWNEYPFWFLDCGLHIYHSNLHDYNAIAPAADGCEPERDRGVCGGDVVGVLEVAFWWCVAAPRLA